MNGLGRSLHVGETVSYQGQNVKALDGWGMRRYADSDWLLVEFPDGTRDYIRGRHIGYPLPEPRPVETARPMETISELPPVAHIPSDVRIGEYSFRIEVTPDGNFRFTAVS